MPDNPKLNERLALNFAGLRMRSPIGVAPIGMPAGKKAAVTPESHAEILFKHVEAGAGFVYVPGTEYISKEMLEEYRAQSRPRELVKKPSDSRWLKVGRPGHGAEAVYHIVFPATEPPERRLTSYEKWGKVIDILKKKLPRDVPIIGSLMPLAAFPETAVASAKKAIELGVDMIEVNISKGSSPGIAGAVEYYLERDYPLITVGSLVGDHPDLAVKVAAAVVKAVNVPVGVKISPETGFPRLVGLVRDLKAVGVKYIQAFNHSPTVAPPDIYNGGRPRWSFVDGNPFVGTSGEVLRTTLYKDIAAIAKFCPGIDIAAAGGLMAPEHAVEAMMLGARLPQFCTGVLLQGRSLLRNTAEFLVRFMDEQGYRSVDDFIGQGVQYIKPMDHLEMNTDRVIAEVNPARCKGSGVCTDSICVAMVRENGRARIKAEDCSGCGLCVVACPNQAISLRLLA
ncbi:MAG: 4Fe-4S binding protein [Chloroflexi bacterium]|nr:4Fe-4S binding protein [Chloroflexota bacterium]